MHDEGEIPSIGGRSHGRLLVCMGDDRPDQWAPWLESLVFEFERLEMIADEHSFKLQTGSHGSLRGWQDFCEAMGVEVRSEFWEGSLTSGQFVTGWIRVGGTRDAKKAGKTLLLEVERFLLTQLRARRIEELSEIGDLESLVERTRDDRAALLAQIGVLKTALEGAQSAKSDLEHALADIKKYDSAALNLDCLRLAGAVLSNERTRLLAGPLALWDDGVVYALTSRGRIRWPEDAAPSILLKHLKQSGHPTVEVGEMTEIGRGLNGPFYRTGTSHIAGWASVWREVEQNRERKFVVADPRHAPTVGAIYEYFKNQLGHRA